uniref:Glucagon / GIP / secretin / VIP family domain-containing protein n=1 Tax=Amphiprion ocellaris TaxID=80972 RepID=A0A3Q1CIV9_AMPOC
NQIVKVFLGVNLLTWILAGWDVSSFHTFGQRIIRNFKRHSDGTFTHDFTRYLDKMKAKDFVEWLASTKREG